MGSLLALALWAAAVPARPPATEPPEEAGRARGGPGELDDPAGRYAAQERGAEGRPRPAALLERLRAAARERDRVGVSAAARAGAPRSPAAAVAAQAAAVPGNDWINLGPATADYETNGVVFHQVDSGRLRSIVPHPADPGILFVATAGGGIWKTYDASCTPAPCTTWEPLTDRLPGGLGSGALAMDPRNPDILVYGFGDPFDSGLQNPGIVVTTDGGYSWSQATFQRGTSKGAPALATQVRDLAVDPNDSNHVLAATDLGLFVSSDALAADPAQPGSLPGSGAHWAQAALPACSSCSAWSLGWAGGNWLVSGQARDAAGDETTLVLFVSRDGAATWTSLTAQVPGSAQAGRATLAVAPSTAQDPLVARIYLLASNAKAASGSGTWSTLDVFRSDDGGRSWVGLGVNSRGVPLNPNSDQRDLDVLHDQSWYNQAIAVDPLDPDAVFVGGNLALLRTVDGGASWSVIADWLPASSNLALPYLHADSHAIAATLAGGTRNAVYYFGGDGGIFRSDDVLLKPPGQSTLSDQLNRGIVSHLAYSVACAPESFPSSLHGFLIGGLQDDGTRLRALPALDPNASGPDSFDQVYGGDGFDVAVSSALAPATGLPAAILATSVGGTGSSALHLSVDGGRTFSDLQAGIDPHRLPFIVRLAADNAPAGDGQTFLTFTVPSSPGATDARVYRVQGASARPAWTDVSGVVSYPGGGAPRAAFVSYSGAGVAPHRLAAHPRSAGVYLMDGDAGSTFVTADGGAHWAAGNPIGSGADAANPTFAVKGSAGLAFDWSDATNQTFYAASIQTLRFDTRTGADVGPIPAAYGHLFRTADGGLTWQSVVGSAQRMLPNVPASAVQVDPNDAATLYVGTQLGLYVSRDRGATFDRMGNGLPLVDVTALCVSPGSGKIVVATYGRGFWQIDQAASVPGGAHGQGDLDYDGALDAFDLVALTALMGTTNASDAYRQEADLVGQVSAVDDADLAAFLGRFGGAP